MTGRVYLDWNASAPLRPEARAAAIAAMDAGGNPSSVHAEGRAAWAVIERARAQVARLVGADPDQVVFTSGATEANAIVMRFATAALHSATAHASLIGACAYDLMDYGAWPVGPDGLHDPDPNAFEMAAAADSRAGNGAAVGDYWVALCAANGETGVVNDPARLSAVFAGRVVHVDASQAAGRLPLDFSAVRTDATGLEPAPLAYSFALSAHKLGGPAGVGAVVSTDLESMTDAIFEGGAQERGVRAGTPNVAGIAGFGAAAEVARRELEDGAWDRVATLRASLEERLVAAAPDAIILGAGAQRLANTTCVAVRGWRGETQVMAMDLAGFAISAGSACSSGKVGPSHVLSAMGCDDVTAASMIRISLGPQTTEDEIARFADAWTRAYRTRRPQAA